MHHAAVHCLSLGEVLDMFGRQVVIVNTLQLASTLLTGGTRHVLASLQLIHQLQQQRKNQECTDYTARSMDKVSLTLRHVGFCVTVQRLCISCTLCSITFPLTEDNLLESLPPRQTADLTDRHYASHQKRSRSRTDDLFLKKCTQEVELRCRPLSH